MLKICLIESARVLLKAFLRSANLNNFTPNTSLPWVVSLTPAKTEFGCVGEQDDCFAPRSAACSAVETFSSLIDSREVKSLLVESVYLASSSKNT